MLEIGLWKRANDIVRRQPGIRSSSSAAEVHLAFCNAAQDGALAQKCGTRFQNIVLKCLKGDFGVNNQDDNILRTGLQAAFQEKVLNVLLDMTDHLKEEPNLPE